MIRAFLHALSSALLLGVVCQCSSAGQKAPGPNRPVRVYVTVTGKGKSLPTPDPAKLRVSIGKQPAQIVSLRFAGADKLRFAVLVDVSGSNAWVAAHVKQAAAAIFQSLLTKGIEGYLVLFTDHIVLSEKPAEPAVVKDTLEGVQFGGRSAVFDAIRETCRKILDRPGDPKIPRRVLFLISDGVDNHSHIRPEDAENAAEEGGVSIFLRGIAPNPSVPKVEPMKSGLSRTAWFLRDACRLTGGQAIFLSPYTLEKDVQPLLNDIHQQWAPDVTPAQQADHRVHSLTVRSSQKGLSFSAPARVFLP